MEELIERWTRAAERAAEENVRVIRIDGQYRATSSSQALESYLLQQTDGKWSCDCPANSEYGMPCKHLSALADVLGLDVLSDMRVDLDALRV